MTVVYIVEKEENEEKINKIKNWGNRGWGVQATAEKAQDKDVRYMSN